MSESTENSMDTSESTAAPTSAEDKFFGVKTQIATKSKEKEASSEEEADEAIKVASEAVQYGRIMALGFVNGLQDLMTEGEE